MKKVIFGCLMALAASMMFMSCSEQLNVDYGDIESIRAGTIEDKLKWYQENPDYVKEHQAEYNEWYNKYGKYVK